MDARDILTFIGDGLDPLVIAWNEGRKNADDGYYLTKNPYGFLTPERAQWEDGWHFARQLIAANNLRSRSYPFMTQTAMFARSRVQEKQAGQRRYPRGPQG